MNNLHLKYRQNIKISACSTLCLAPSAYGKVRGICGRTNSARGYNITSNEGYVYDPKDDTDGDESIAVACNPDGTQDVYYMDPDGGSDSLLGVTNLEISCTS